MAEQKVPKRVTSEIKQLTEKPPDGVVVEQDKTDLFLWHIQLTGPDKSPYEKGKFKINCKIPADYPFKPPDITFTTKIYHPNIKFDTGELCQEIYKKDWAPTKKIADILNILISLLQAPNMEAPVEPDIAKEYSNSYDQFLKKCKENVQKFAK